MKLVRVCPALIASAVASLLTGCGGGGSGAPSTPAPPATAAEACQSLSGMTIAAGDIGLATRGARVTAVQLQAAGGSGLSANPEFCRVSVQIDPVDPLAAPIKAQINLPTNWNRKALHMGGGGWDGFLVTGEGTLPATTSRVTPLASGYATFGSDGGHSVPSPLSIEEHVQAFLNDEVVANYAGAQLKKTRDVAMAIIRARYREAPRRTYFAGQSGGGREALIVTQRFGADYDGVISYYPAIGTPLILNLARVSRALAAPGAYPNPAKQTLLHNAVVSACDSGDGVADGLVSNPGACSFNVTSLRCSGGADTGNSCLSDAQINALDLMASDLTLSYSLLSGETGILGYGVYRGVDLASQMSGLGLAAPAPVVAVGVQPAHSWLYDIFYRGVLSRDPGANSLAFDPLAPGVYQARLSYLSTLMYSVNPDLSVFHNRGGKLLIIQGNDDPLIPVGSTSTYYQSVVSTMGSGTVNSFLRYFTVPGYGHGVGSFIVDWDSLTALDNWVENGTAVDQPIATDASPATPGRTRPLCRFPTWPKYQGTGDINSAASYACET